jgi:hypothetical protein
MSSETTPRITVLRDDPLFATRPYDSASDTFAYAAFAKALLDVLEHNDPPLSMGLFGPWGIGKSTIVNILFSKIRANPASTLFPIYFNAWKYSGDSFRRQFLLEVASEVYGSRTDKRVQRLEHLNYTEVLSQKPEKSWLDELKELLTGKVIRTRRSGIIRIIFGLFLLAMGAGFTLKSSSPYPFITALLGFVIIFVLKLKFEDVFVIEDNQVYDPKMIFPEQFEEEFQTLISPAQLQNKHAVIVIDDIDRCDSATIKDILISTKNFVGQPNAYFLIPCDDLNIINIFEDPAHKSGYRDEMLRKYFNVGLRIPPISNRDLIDFANRMARETKLREDIVQLAVLADYRDARRIKHFANNFLLKLHIARERVKSGHLLALTPERELQLAKLVIIEDCAPPIFTQLVKNPGLLQLLESSALSPDGQHSGLKEYHLEHWGTEYPGLKKALIGSKYVAISDLEVLLSLKADNLELKVPSGALFRAALLQGAPDSLTGMLSEIAGRDKRQALADLIDDSLRQATGPFLSNCIASTLSLPLGSFFTEVDAKRIARQLNLGLLKEDQRVWVQSATRIVDILGLSEPDLVHRLFGKYVDELEHSQEQPSKAIETVTALYPRLDNKGPFIDALNEKFLIWGNSEQGLAFVSAFSREKLISEQKSFPSDQILDSILKALDPSSGGAKQNELRKEIIFANWYPHYGKILAPVFWKVVQNEHVQGTFNWPLRLSLKSLCEKPEILNSPEGGEIANHLPATLGRAKTEDDKNLVRDCMIALAVAGQSGAKAATLSNLSSLWQTDADQRVRRDLRLAETMSADTATADTISGLIIASQTDMVAREQQSPTDRTLERIRLISEFEKFAPANFLNLQFVSSLGIAPDTAYDFWEKLIHSRQDKLTQETSTPLIKKALELVSTPGSLNQRKPRLLKLAMDLFSTQPQAEQAGFTRQILELLWHPDITIRNSVGSTLSSLRIFANQGDVRIHLNAGIHENLHKIGKSTLADYKLVVEALIANKDLWNESSSRSITQLAVTLSSDDNLKAPALDLLESINEFDQPDRQDVLHVLTSIEATQGPLSDRAKTLLTRIKKDPIGRKTTGPDETDMDPNAQNT